MEFLTHSHAAQLNATEVLIQFSEKHRVAHLSHLHSIGCDRTQGAHSKYERTRSSCKRRAKSSSSAEAAEAVAAMFACARRLMCVLGDAKIIELHISPSHQKHHTTAQPNQDVYHTLNMCVCVEHNPPVAAAQGNNTTNMRVVLVSSLAARPHSAASAKSDSAPINSYYKTIYVRCMYVCDFLCPCYNAHRGVIYARVCLSAHVVLFSNQTTTKVYTEEDARACG